jgi:NADP-dependent 3-hydroxy acid dehydrogenase YdfG
MQPRVAFVTGASSGLGEAIARRYAAGGVKVVAAARRRDLLDGLASEFAGEPELRGAPDRPLRRVAPGRPGGLAAPDE